MKLKRRRRGGELEVVGYSLPLKHMLGGEGEEENAYAMDGFLNRKSEELREILFGRKIPTERQIREAVSEGVLNPEYLRRMMKYDYGYFKLLAYHMFVKADVLRIACEQSVVLTSNPVADVLGVPMECAIVPKNAGLEGVKGFLMHVNSFLEETCGVQLTDAKDIRNKRVGENAYYPIMSARELLVYPDNFRANLKLQRPPDIQKPKTAEDVRTMRAWFNDWYRRTPTLASALVEELSKVPASAEKKHIIAVNTPEGVSGGIHLTVTTTDHSRAIRNRIMKDRI